AGLRESPERAGEHASVRIRAGRARTEGAERPHPAELSREPTLSLTLSRRPPPSRWRVPSQRREHALEIRRGTGIDHQSLSRHPMRQGEAKGVEHQAWREARDLVAIDRVAEDRQSAVGEVDADLVLAARPRTSLDEERARQGLEETELRLRLLAARSDCRHPALARGSEAPLHGPAPGRIDGRAHGERVVGLLDHTFSKRAGEARI